MIGYLPHTGDIIRPAMVEDAYGNTTAVWSPPASTTRIACWVQQNSRATEVSDGRRALATSFLMLTNEPADLLEGTERFLWLQAPGGPLLLEMDGPAEAAYTLRGFHHTEATLRRLDG